MADDDRRRLFTWGAGVLGSLATTFSVLFNLRDAIPWHTVADYVINALTVGRIAVTLILSLYFVVWNGRPFHRALSYLFLVYMVAAFWALLTDWIPALFVREIRSLVFRALMIGNELAFLIAILTWARPDEPRGGS